MRLSVEVMISKVSLLSSTYKFPTQFINKMIEELGSKDCELTLNKRLTNNEKLILILNAQGSLLFKGSHDINIEIRKRVIENWNESSINDCFNKWGKSLGNSKEHKE
jgi:hypothetical protein